MIQIRDVNRLDMREQKEAVVMESGLAKPSVVREVCRGEGLGDGGPVGAGQLQHQH